MVALLIGMAWGGPTIDAAALDRRLERAHRRGMTGVSAVLVGPEGVLWAGAAGFADAERGVAMTPETPVRMGSITKVLNAMAALRQVEAGLYPLDAPVEQVLPEVGHRSRFTPIPITVGMLGTHQSGLPSDLAAGRGDASRSFTARTATLFREHVATPPGTVTAYSNLGASLLGHVVERAAGEPWADAMETWVFEPLGLDVSLAVGPELPDGCARPHRAGQPVEPMVIVDQPAGGLVASVTDLVPVARLLLGQTVGPITPDVLEPMRVPGPDAPLDRGGSQGFGAFHASGPHGPMIGHGGDTTSFHAELRAWPDAGVALVLATNEAEAVTTLRELADTLEQDVLGRARDPEPAWDDHGGLPLESGTWMGAGGVLELDVTPRGAWLLRAGRRLRLRDTGDGTWSARALHGGRLAREVIPCPACEEARPHDVLVVATADGHRTVVGARALLPALTPAWLGRFGTYVVDEPGLDGSLTLFDRAGTLGVEISLDVNGARAGLRSSLHILDDTRAAVPGVGRGLGEVLEAVPTTDGEGIRALGVVFASPGATEVTAPAPPPFTAARIREGMPLGRTIDWTLESPAGTVPMAWEVIAHDADGLVLRSSVGDGPAEDARHTWDELRSHAAFPGAGGGMSPFGDGTLRTEDVVLTTPLGAMRTVRYDVREGASWKTFWFDPHRPGAPVLHVAREEGVEVLRLTQVARGGPP